MVSNASDDLPEPLTPVMMISLPEGNVTSTFFRLCVRAPRTTSGARVDALAVGEPTVANVRETVKVQSYSLRPMAIKPRPTGYRPQSTATTEPWEARAATDRGCF